MKWKFSIVWHILSSDTLKCYVHSNLYMTNPRELRNRLGNVRNSLDGIFCFITGSQDKNVYVEDSSCWSFTKVLIERRISKKYLGNETIWYEYPEMMSKAEDCFLRFKRWWRFFIPIQNVNPFEHGCILWTELVLLLPKGSLYAYAHHYNTTPIQ